MLGNVTASKTTNCKLLDDNSIIPFFHTRKNATPLAKTANEEEGNEDSSTEQHILTYIAGLVVKKLLKQIKCITCIMHLGIMYYVLCILSNKWIHLHQPL